MFLTSITLNKKTNSLKVFLSLYHYYKNYSASTYVRTLFSVAWVVTFLYFLVRIINRRPNTPTAVKTIPTKNITICLRLAVPDP
jgi:hypothetical protein